MTMTNFRKRLLTSYLPSRAQKSAFARAIKSANGDFGQARSELKDKLDPELLARLAFVHEVADIADDRARLIEHILGREDIRSLRDLALKGDPSLLEAVDPDEVLDVESETSANAERLALRKSFLTRLYARATSAFLQRMAQDKLLPIENDAIQANVAKFLDTHPEFDIRTTSLYKVLNTPDALKDIHEKDRPETVHLLKALQRIQAVSHEPQAVPALMDARLTSAFQIAQLPEKTFVRAMDERGVDETAARQIHANAINVNMRNEHALMHLRDAARGAGLAVIDGDVPAEQRREIARVALREMLGRPKGAEVKGQDQSIPAIPFDLDSQFGLDHCECEECLSIYSPAAYFVELLQFLRNNNLGPDPIKPGTGPEKNPHIHPGIKGTPLEVLFRRRPDLGCLELTCENTFTNLPYVDLVNEVMESFIVHHGEYHNSDTNPVLRQAKLDSFNVEDETSGELLAAPQNVNYQAYRKLKDAVYPFTLPYHQPIDEARIFLEYMGTSRWELINTFRTPTEPCLRIDDDPVKKKQLAELHQAVIDRAVDAEFLGITQEEYVILTQEAFWPKEYFELTQGCQISDPEYAAKVGVRDVWEYYGYEKGTPGKDNMQDTLKEKGLAFVKKQFLPRTGIAYTDLVELLKTYFINPDAPKGGALTMMASIRFSYRFLQTLVVNNTQDLDVRFGKLIAFLEKSAHYNALQPAEVCKPRPEHCLCETPEKLRQWVHCWFDRIGKLIVLDSGEAPQLPFSGRLSYEEGINKKTDFGNLLRDGKIVDQDNNELGRVRKTIGRYRLNSHSVVDEHGNGLGTLSEADQHGLSEDEHVVVAPYVDGFSSWPAVQYLTLDTDTGQKARIWITGSLTGFLTMEPDFTIVLWQPPRDSCDLNKARLVHLDGSDVTVEEYGRMHRIIMLWRKLGWSIDETDNALFGLGNHCQAGAGEYDCECDPDDHPSIDNDGRSADCDTAFDCPAEQTVNYTITAKFIHELRAVRRLETMTALPLPTLLAFWANIGTRGKKSLYAKLFLSHNIKALDPVFKADPQGEYLTEPTKISAHIPVLMAALRVKADDLEAIVRSAKLKNELTVESVTVLYRYAVLAKLLKVRPSQLQQVFELVKGEPDISPGGKTPFGSAWSTLGLLEFWAAMEAAGFDLEQLNYVVKGEDDPHRPVGPQQQVMLGLAKMLFDGLNAIRAEHPDIPQGATVSSEQVRAKASLLFDQSFVDRIVGLLNGTLAYAVRAPNRQGKYPKAPGTELAKKLRYVAEKDNGGITKSSLQLTGILTGREKTEAIDLWPNSANDEWKTAIEKAERKATAIAGAIIDEAIAEMFPKGSQQRAALLVGDSPSSGHEKRYLFLRTLLPILRKELERRFIVETTTALSGLTDKITSLLLQGILEVGNQSALDVFRAISLPTGQHGWDGFLIPTSNATYTFAIISDAKHKPAPIVIDGRELNFVEPADLDLEDTWYAAHALTLKAGKLYSLTLTDRVPTTLMWRTELSAIARIPTTALLPGPTDPTIHDMEVAYTKLIKAAIVVTGFKLTPEEIEYIHKNPHFGDPDLNALTLRQWRRLRAYVDLRDSLPSSDQSLIELFKWAADTASSKDKLVKRIEETTSWSAADVESLIAPTKADDPRRHFDLYDNKHFVSEENLLKLRDALAVSGKISRVTIRQLFKWAQPIFSWGRRGDDFNVYAAIAKEIRGSLRSRFSQEDWEQAVRPLNDKLRDNGKQALVAYLLVQPALLEWGRGVLDADRLYEFFLIDVQMGACMETSRIAQGIASVQLFIQRCLLGQEEAKNERDEEIGVAGDALDRNRWQWMQRYRVWEANRKVFLYPENWLSISPRDDRSPFFKELESELLQKDLDIENIQEALRNYVYKAHEVANLRVVGVFVETPDNLRRLHVFACTRDAPFSYFHRRFSFETRDWSAWERVDVDIPNYDEVGGEQLQKDDAYILGATIRNGVLLTPVVWNGRLIIFFPQATKKESPSAELQKVETFGALNDASPNILSGNFYWEIKLGFSEYRQGKWTKKQVSSGSLQVRVAGRQWMTIALLKLVPSAKPADGADNALSLTAYYGNTDDPIGYFSFRNSSLVAWSSGYKQEDKRITDFHYRSEEKAKRWIRSLQARSEDSRGSMVLVPEAEGFARFEDASGADQIADIQVSEPTPTVLSIPFYHRLSDKLVSASYSETPEALLEVIWSVGKQNLGEAFGSYQSQAGAELSYHELKKPYSLYNWELGFHAPMALVDRLLREGKFELALRACELVLNPLEEGKPQDTTRFWRFPPFKWSGTAHALEQFFGSLLPGTPSAPINIWRSNPFNPHIVARNRPVAYMKWVAATYMKILISWGDHLFRQDTRETINQATQLYVLAAHLYGSGGQRIPKRGTTSPESYNSLIDRWDAFGNAIIELELIHPASNQIVGPLNAASIPGAPNVFGSLSTLYFCLPDNPELTNLRATIADRLFKIRHCENIEGVFRQLPLFEPPIDPALLVQATAQGLSLAAVLNDFNSPIPNYRFNYLLQKALEVCSELKALGNAFLQVKEKGDSEAMQRLRASHETAVHKLVLSVREQQLDEADKALDALYQSREGAVNRMQHFVRLLGEDTARIPGADKDFEVLANVIERPVEQESMRLSPLEKEELDKAAEAADRQREVGEVELLASVLHALPNVDIVGAFWGVGGKIQYGPANLAAVAQAIARHKQIKASDVSFQSSNASRKAGFVRQRQERVHQANIVGFEIKSIDRQILTQKIRRAIVEKEIGNQEKQIENAQEMDEFLRTKYSNQELYGWMETQIRALYRQTYGLAYDLAKRAEKVFRFERGVSDKSFIEGGYWDPAHDGLLSGERLYIGLKQLEAAYGEKRGHDFEVTKNISLHQLNPIALLQLRSRGICEFEVPEVLFDMGYPGHYMRRIRSVALSFACVVGPNTSVNCTLRLLKHRFRKSPLAQNASGYLESTDAEDERFATTHVPTTAIAVSGGQNDSGVFELSFRDERYTPFEGGGAISRWRLQLPEEFREFDYGTISDVIMQLRYTSLDGGDKLRGFAAAAVETYVKSAGDRAQGDGLFALFDLPRDFSNAWYEAQNASPRIVKLGDVTGRLPFFASGEPSKVKAHDIYVISSKAKLPDGSEITESGKSVGTFKAGSIEGVENVAHCEAECGMTNWELKIGDAAPKFDEFMLIVRYTIG